MFSTALLYQSLQNKFVKSSDDIYSPLFDDGLYSNVPLYDTLTNREKDKIAYIYKVINEYQSTALTKKISEMLKTMYNKPAYKTLSEIELVALEDLYCSICISRILNEEVSGREKDDNNKHLTNPEIISKKAQDFADALKKVIDLYGRYASNKNSKETCDTSKAKKISPFTLDQAKVVYSSFAESKALNEKKILMDQFINLQDIIDKSDRLMNCNCMDRNLNLSVFNEIAIIRRKVYINYENYTKWLENNAFTKSFSWDQSDLEKIVKDTRKSMQNVFEKYLLDETIKE